MELGPCNTVDSAVTAIQSVRSFKPYKYGGRWFVSVSRGVGLAFRSKADLSRRIARENPNVDAFECAIVQPSK